MYLFIYKPNHLNPILFIITKLSDPEELEKLHTLTDEIFLILMDEKIASDESILVFSIINDYDQKTENLILPSIKSNNDLVNKYCNETNNVNKTIVDILENNDTEFYLEINNDKILLHMKHININGYAKFYNLTT